jgi:hypothetical protein
MFVLVAVVVAVECMLVWIIDSLKIVHAAE